MQIRKGISVFALSCCAAAMGSAAANAQAIQFFAVLDGGNEVSGTTARAGDLNGNGTASILLGGAGQLCFSLLVRGIANPTAAHIHVGNPGVAGGIVVTLTPVPANGTLGSSSNCLNVPAATINQIRNNPGHFYVNVHTGQFPNGAIRGQLF